MIDSEGYRLNVGIILCNANERLFLAKRIGQHSWQFPQGDIRRDEPPDRDMFRELAEGIGQRPEHMQVISYILDRLRYRLPKHLIRRGNQPACIGQKQVQCLLRMVNSEDTLQLGSTERPGFDTGNGWITGIHYALWYRLSDMSIGPLYGELAPLLFPCRPPRRLFRERDQHCPIIHRRRSSLMRWPHKWLRM